MAATMKPTRLEVDTCAREPVGAIASYGESIEATCADSTRIPATATTISRATIARVTAARRREATCVMRARLERKACRSGLSGPGPPDGLAAAGSCR
jgi:hypothetical protein